MMKTVGVFGGTFDPVHDGHIQMAIEARQSLALDEVRLVPCHRPPHRETPNLTSRQRLALLRLALEDSAKDGAHGLSIDDRELGRDKPSYTVDTLISLRQDVGDNVSLVLLMGADAYSQLTCWHQWQRLRELAHIAVITRPDSPLPVDGLLADWLADPGSVQQNQERVHQAPAGDVILLRQRLLAISATHIREQLAAGVAADSVKGISPAVAEYINRYGLYR